MWSRIGRTTDCVCRLVAGEGEEVLARLSHLPNPSESSSFRGNSDDISGCCCRGNVDVDSRRSRESRVHRRALSLVDDFAVTVNEHLHCSEPTPLRSDEMSIRAHLSTFLVLSRSPKEEGTEMLDGERESTRVRTDERVGIGGQRLKGG